MKRVLTCGILLLGVPLLNAGGKCVIWMSNPPTWWEWFKALYQLHTDPACK